MTKVITREELKAALDAGNIIAVDALPETYYATRHLPGAVSLVAAEVTTKAAEVLPDKNAAIVVYCSDATCANSQAVAELLTAQGYPNVSRYADGINDWVAAGLPVQTGTSGD